MHPRDEQLISYILGEASEGERQSTRRHLEGGCSRCEERTARLRQLIHHLRTDHDLDPPDDWVQRATALLASRPNLGLVGRLRRFWGEVTPAVARLVQDSLGAPDLAVAGVRSGSSRRLCFESDDLELDLSLEAGADATIVTGQLVTLQGDPTPAVGARVLVTAEPHFLSEETADVEGEFAFSAQFSAPFRVHVAYGDRFVLFEVPAPTRQ
jgi:hypothetical protein